MPYATLPGLQLDWVAGSLGGGETFVSWRLYRRRAWNVVGITAWTLVQTIPDVSTLSWTDYQVAPGVVYDYAITTVFLRSGVQIETSLPTQVYLGTGSDAASWVVASGNDAVAASTAHAQSGTTSYLGVYRNGVAGDGDVGAVLLPSQPAGSYRLSAWLWIPSMGGSASVNLARELWSNATGSAIVAADATKLSQWQLLGFAFTLSGASGSTSYVVMRWSNAPSPADGTQLYWDQVLLESGAIASGSVSFGGIFLHDPTDATQYLEFRGNAQRVAAQQAQTQLTGWGRPAPTLYVGTAQTPHYQLTGTPRTRTAGIALWADLVTLIDRQRTQGASLCYRNGATHDADFVALAPTSGGQAAVPMTRSDVPITTQIALDLSVITSTGAF